MKNKIFLGLILGLVIVAGYFIYKKLNPPKLPPYLIEAVGFVDGDLIHVNAKYPGRIVKEFVKEGDEVKKGEVLALQDTKDLEIKKNATLKEIKAKEIELNLTKKILPQDIEIAKNAYLAKEKALKMLNYEIKTLKAVIAQDEKDLKRFKKLVNKNLDKKHDFEMARLKLIKDKNSLNSLLVKRKILKNEIAIAKSNLKKASDSLLKIKALSDSIKALKEKVASINKAINDMKLISPVNGFVEKRISLPGEVVGAGMPVIDVVDNNSFYLKVYIDEMDNGKVKLNQKAEIFLDNNLSNPIKAKVVYISKRAEFTPKEVATRNDRITRVYEVWLRPIKPNPYLKLGLPAIGLILIDDNKKLPKTLKGLPVLW